MQWVVHITVTDFPFLIRVTAMLLMLLSGVFFYLFRRFNFILKLGGGCVTKSQQIVGCFFFLILIHERGTSCNKFAQ